MILRKAEMRFQANYYLDLYDKAVKQSAESAKDRDMR